MLTEETAGAAEYLMVERAGAAATLTAGATEAYLNPADAE